MKHHSNVSEYISQIISWPLKFKIILLVLLTIIIIGAGYLIYFKPKRAITVTNVELIKALTTEINKQQVDLPNYLQTNKTVIAEQALLGNFLLKEIVQLNAKFNLTLRSITPITTNQQQAVQLITQGRYWHLLALMQALANVNNVSINNFIIQPGEKNSASKVLTMTLDTYTV